MDSKADLVNQEIVSGDNLHQNQYLTFILGDEEYGVDILRVQEIRGWDKVTPIPNAPPFIKGVVNLRGTIVSILDLRERFEMQEVEYNELTVIVVLKVKGDGKERIMGIVVDAVSEVYHIEQDDLKDPPDLGYAIDMDYMKGMATVEDKMVIVLNVDHLMSLRELDNIPAIDRTVTDKIAMGK